MRRFLSLFTMLMLCGVLAFAQTRTVSGRVTDPTGKPVPFASVVVKGGTTGVQTDVNGEYTIRVNTGDVLQISQTNYNPVEITVGTTSSLTTVMDLRTNTIQEVVVTSAFNTRRTARSTSSNVQNVASEQLNAIRQTNVNDALAGKVSGIQVRSQSTAKLGATVEVRLRGENSLGLGGGALYVVDGTIIPNSNDINPDDIEDVTVLQGPAASALFGPAGSNGAIVINTKKARRGQRGLGIEINSGITFDKVYILPDYQNSYAGGQYPDLIQFHYQPGVHPAAWAALDGKYYHDYQEDVSWGPRMVGQEYIPWYSWYPGHERSYTTARLNPQPTNVRDYFNTGVTKMNNVNFTKGGDAYRFRASYTNLDQKGVVEGSYLKKHTLNVSAGIDLSSKLELSTNINYINQDRNAENDDTYSNNTTGQFNQWFHRNIDMDILRELAGLKTPDGVLATWNHGNPDLYDPNRTATMLGAYYWFSPYSYQQNIYNNDTRNRFFGDATLTYKPFNSFRVAFSYRRHQLSSNNEIWQSNDLQNSIRDNLAGFNYWEQLARRAAPWGGYGVGYSTQTRQNYELIGTYTKKFNDFAVNANAGAIIQKTSSNTITANTMGGLVIPNLYLLSNSKNDINYNNAIVKSAGRALFVRADVGYRNMIFLEGTFRKDYSSTEAKGYAIDTYSAGASFVFSDLVNRNGNTFLSYGKIRGSIGQVLNSLAPYQNTALYAINPFQWNGNFVQAELNTQIDPALRGATNDEKEIGIELRFLKNRLGISATYWNRTNKDFPFNQSIYPGTGYTSVQTNVGEVKKTGYDLQATIVPVRSNNVDWTINATWGYLDKNDVISIAPGVDRIVLASGQSGTSAYMVSEVGQKWGQLRGIGFKRINGQPVLTSNGDYEYEEEVNFGSTLPKYTGGIQNTLTLFKNFVMNVNIDYSYGGKWFSLSEFYGHATGLYAATAVLNDRGIPVRDPVEDGGGVHVFGVDETGHPVDYYVDARHYWEQFPYGDGIAEPFIRDMTFVKLRELSLGYKLPVERMGISRWVKNATFSVIARNPWLIYAQGRGFDPSEMSLTYGEDGQMPGTRGIGFNLKVGF